MESGIFSPVPHLWNSIKIVDHLIKLFHVIYIDYQNGLNLFDGLVSFTLQLVALNLGKLTFLLAFLGGLYFREL